MEKNGILFSTSIVPLILPRSYWRKLTSVKRQWLCDNLSQEILEVKSTWEVKSTCIQWIIPHANCQLVMWIIAFTCNYLSNFNWIERKMFFKKSSPWSFCLVQWTAENVDSCAFLSFALKLTIFLLLLVIFGQCRAWRLSDWYLGQLVSIAVEKTSNNCPPFKSFVRETYRVWCECRNINENPHGGCSGYEIEPQKIWENQPNVKGSLYTCYFNDL